MDRQRQKERDKENCIHLKPLRLFMAWGWLELCGCRACLFSKVGSVDSRVVSYGL